MGLTATMHHLVLTVSDVDRGVYETLDLRVARHPSETVRYMMTRVFAYALSYEDGIAFSKGGLSNPDEPPLSVRDATGLLTAWIEVGMPSAERLHKASKAARRVLLFTSGDVEVLRRDAAGRPIHRAAELEIWRIDAAFLAEVEALVGRDTVMELVRNDGQLYLTVGGKVLESQLLREHLGNSHAP